jgi:hypothetical protein
MIKYKKSELSKANRDIEKLLLKIIETKRGGKFNRPLNKITGNLRKNIKSLIYESNGNLYVDLDVMEYYQFLDEGTRRITNPWFLTEELTESDEFVEIVEGLIRDGIEDVVYKVFSKIKP